MTAWKDTHFHLRRTRNTRADARGADVRWYDVGPGSHITTEYGQGQQVPAKDLSKAVEARLHLFRRSPAPGVRFDSAGGASSISFPSGRDRNRRGFRGAQGKPAAPEGKGRHVCRIKRRIQ